MIHSQDKSENDNGRIRSQINPNNRLFYFSFKHKTQGHPNMKILRIQTLNFGGNIGGKSNVKKELPYLSGIHIRQCGHYLNFLRALQAWNYIFLRTKKSIFMPLLFPLHHLFVFAETYYCFKKLNLITTIRNQHKNNVM